MILTNAHVIENSDRLNISLLDGNEFSGEMIGINTAIIPSAQGLSFSIGIDSVKEIARYLISDGKVMKAFLGLITHEIDINPRIKNFYRLSSKKGLLITGLESSYPASRANLHIGLVSPHTPFTLSPLQAELLYCPSSADMSPVRSH